MAEDAIGQLAEQGVLGDRELSRINLHREDFFDAPIGDIDIFTYFDGGGPSVRQIEQKLTTEGKDGAKLVIYGGRDQTYQSDALIPVMEEAPGVAYPVRIYQLHRPQPQ